MPKINAVIFDWAGTTVDFGSTSPVSAFMEAFRRAGIEVTDEETRAPMGLLKRDHIRTMLRMPRIAKAWQDRYGRAPNADDVEALYSDFEPALIWPFYLNIATLSLMFWKQLPPCATRASKSAQPPVLPLR